MLKENKNIGRFLFSFKSALYNSGNFELIYLSQLIATVRKSGFVSSCKKADLKVLQFSAYLLAFFIKMVEHKIKVLEGEDEVIWMPLHELVSNDL